MKLKYLIYTITLTGLTACGDFLEPKSQSQYIPKDANALQEMLIGEAYPQQKDTKFLNYQEILADDVEQNQVEGYEFPENDKADMEIFEILYSCNPICSKYEKNWDNKQSILGRTFMNIF